MADEPDVSTYLLRGELEGGEAALPAGKHLKWVAEDGSALAGPTQQLDYAVPSQLLPPPGGELTLRVFIVDENGQAADEAGPITISFLRPPPPPEELISADGLLVR